MAASLERKLEAFRDLDLHGSHLALDFVNTVGQWVPQMERDRLKRYDDLVTWAVYAGVLAEAEAMPLLRAASRQPDRAAAVLEEALRLRQTLHDLFAALAHGERPAPDDLASLNAALATALPHRQLAAAGEGYGWAWSGPPDALERVLWPLAYEAAALLTAPEVARVRECPAPDCGWLFLDMSKNRSRRWCSMETCGNQAKVRRHYQRHKGQA